MLFDEYLVLGLESLKDNAKGHFWQCRIGRPVSDGNDDYFDNQSVNYDM